MANPVVKEVNRRVAAAKKTKPAVQKTFSAKPLKEKSPISKLKIKPLVSKR